MQFINDYGLELELEHQREEILRESLKGIEGEREEKGRELREEVWEREEKWNKICFFNRLGGHEVGKHN